MPIYEYVCTDCVHEFETLQKMGATPLSVCPACEKPALKKKISAPGFRLSGSGWYETDFKSGNQKNLAKSENSDKESSKKPETKTETKTETKKNSSAGKEAAA